LKLWDQVELTGGVSYDYLQYPKNIDTSPISHRETDVEQVSPKAGLIWSPLPNTHLRGAYTRSLGGVFYDSSVRLEPTQVGGFNQAFRSIIPESVAGLVPGTRFTTYGAGIDQSFKTGTYITIDGQILESEATKSWGAVTNAAGLLTPDTPTHTPQKLDYTEDTLTVSLSQLLSDQWSVGVRYRLSYAELDAHFENIPRAGASNFNQDQDATLQQLTLWVNYYHPCGFFSQVNGVWTAQENNGYSPSLSGADFWQFNAWVGYRFLRRAIEVKLGLLNITDQDYSLNPLNLYYDLPRERTLAVSAKFYF